MLTNIWRALENEVFVSGAVLGGVYFFRDVMDWQRGSDKMVLTAHRRVALEI